MKTYIDILIEDNQLTLTDAIITNKNDELYNLQEKYSVKISRSPKSNAVYIFKNKRNFVLRIGHEMTPEQFKQFRQKYQFSENIRTKNVSKEKVENSILKYLSRF